MRCPRAYAGLGNGPGSRLGNVWPPRCLGPYATRVSSESGSRFGSFNALSGDRREME